MANFLLPVTEDSILSVNQNQICKIMKFHGPTTAYLLRGKRDLMRCKEILGVLCVFVCVCVCVVCVDRWTQLGKCIWQQKKKKTTRQKVALTQNKLLYSYISQW